MCYKNTKKYAPAFSVSSKWLLTNVKKQGRFSLLKNQAFQSFAKAESGKDWSKKQGIFTVCVSFDKEKPKFSKIPVFISTYNFISLPFVILKKDET